MNNKLPVPDDVPQAGLQDNIHLLAWTEDLTTHQIRWEDDKNALFSFTIKKATEIAELRIPVPNHLGAVEIQVYAADEGAQNYSPHSRIMLDANSRQDIVDLDNLDVTTGMIHQFQNLNRGTYLLEFIYNEQLPRELDFQIELLDVEEKEFN